MLKEMSALIARHTALSRRHLTPELTLALVTSSCALWTATEDQLPFRDPYWAFYWPGGQAVARYILDNAAVVKNRRLLDVGCGCGAGSIAAAMMGARRVLANDIDTNALVATKLNAALNKIKLETSSKNFIGTKCENFDTIIIGDMFYDEEFAQKLFTWLHGLTEDGKTVIIGDPGRHGLTEARRASMRLLARYQLPADTCLENHGYQETTVWALNK